ncbi:MAG: methyltransferase domain-containing protein, partial [Anaerolineales bacterium]|nr:methyltransferase domain-containing protein [Anaerolineales bacterium]
QSTCPACGAAAGPAFYSLAGAPVHSVLLLETRAAAVGYPRGELQLGLCERCGFIWNMAFDPGRHEYSAKYEATQAYSATFNAFHRRLAEHLIQRYDLHGKDLIEIGCGQGEFLSLLCELGGNRGVGFDPAYVAGRVEGPARNQLRFVADFYSEQYVAERCDFLCCKMTLEHIQPVAEFAGTVRRAVGERPGTVVFFQIPHVTRILRDVAFWDLYYEHCSYFSPGSLARLFRRAGFDVLDLWTDYDDQYLMIEARPGTGAGRPPLAAEEPPAALAQEVAAFTARFAEARAAWQARVAALRAAGQRAVIWGGGSKGVAFLTTLGLQAEIPYAVDINPRKHGTFMAGTGQEIVGPERLREYRPDVVIVMNPIYCAEIQAELDRLGVPAQLWPVG